VDGPRDFTSCAGVIADCTQQTNGDDCGVHLLQNVKTVLNVSFFYYVIIFDIQPAFRCDPQRVDLGKPLFIYFGPY
jgi:Ulp1 family protease